MLFRDLTQALPSLALAALACAATSSMAAAAPTQERKAAPQEKKEAAAHQEKKSKKAGLPSSASKDDAALAKIDEFIQSKKGEMNKNDKAWKTKMPFPPELEFSDDKDYYWNLRTNKGDIKIKLMPEVAPMHVSSTIFLVRSGFYDNLKFHRVIPQFMAQGGCPLGNGRGNPGYKYTGEFDPKVKHDRPGLLSMANAGPGTEGSQFFLTFTPTPWLDGKHTIFGAVTTDGMAVLKALEAQGSRNGRTREPLHMVSSTISVEPKKKKKAQGK